MNTSSKFFSLRAAVRGCALLVAVSPIVGVRPLCASTVTNFSGLGFLTGGNSSTATSVSANGSVVTGYSTYGNGSEQQAFRWTRSGGMLGLGFFADAPNSY